MKPHLLLSILFFSCSSLIAQEQEIKAVDPKTLSNTQVQQVEQQISTLGLTNQAAADLARQKGASEKQVQDMLRRLAGGEKQAGEPVKAGDETQTKEQEVGTEQDAAALAALEAEKRELEKESKREGAVSAEGGVFGAYLFSSASLTFEPNLNIQTPKDYEISIGDQFIVNIWGNSQANYQLTVDQNGQINIPNIGPIFIAGRSFEAASTMIRQRLTAIYEEMGGRNPRTFAQVNLGQLRSIKINLVGEVSTPGTYTLPATATVFNALYLSGGPNLLGSFRNIKIFRDNKELRTIDIYKFLIDGDQSDNIVLKNDDVIFIPTAEKKVRVSGEFKRQAVFELKANENLNDLINFAGGFTVETYLFRMQLYRKTQQGIRILDVLYTDIDKTNLENGDVLISHKTQASYENRVTVLGAVYRPGEYEWKENMVLSELILKADSITPDAFTKKGHIIRYKPDLTQELITFNVVDVLMGKMNYFLQPEDVVAIKSTFSMMEGMTVSVTGHVMAPGTFPFLDNMTIADAIYLSNGLKEGAYKTGHLIRMNPDRTLQFIDFNLDDVFSGAQNMLLQKEDMITIKSIRQMKEDHYINVSGEVISPGRFDYADNMTLRDALYLANGFREQADSVYIQISRRLSQDEAADISDTLVHVFTVSMPRDLNRNTDATSFRLEPYDNIYVRRAPGFRDTGSASIIGEVKYAGPYPIISKRDRISDLVKRAGGLNAEAYEEAAWLERDGIGKVDIDLKKIMRLPKIRSDLFLLPGDILIVPIKPQTVTVAGQVQNPFSTTFVPGRSLKHYISMSGGWSEAPYKSRVYVTYPDGSSDRTRNFIFRFYPEVKPGSVVNVPKKPEKPKREMTGQFLTIASTATTLSIAVISLINMLKN